MNYSTLKKTVALSFASLLAVGAASAQVKDSTMSTASTPKIFGGRAQYRTWSIGINAGVTSTAIAIGGTNSFQNWDAGFGWGVSVRKQLAHSFGLQADFMLPGTTISGDNTDVTRGIKKDVTSFGYSAALGGVVNVGEVDFLRRKNAISFYISASAGLLAYAPKVTYFSAAAVPANVKAIPGYDAGSFTIDEKNHAGGTPSSPGTNTYSKAAIFPIGVGIKFRLSDRVALNLGYTATFTDDDNVDGYHNPSYHKDKYSYGYGGLEFSLGSSSKPNLDWVNPIAIMYDELKDPTLRQEVEALKGRVTNVESAINDLKKDSDGDGVADQFDKCPNTPAGTVVDGSGCPIKFPEPPPAPVAPVAVVAPATPYSNIQFEFDSSVLRTSSYPILDATSADLRTSKKAIWVNGYASSEGTAAHNLQLSKDRANSVKTYLVNSGVDAKRIKVKGLGETHPVADNSTEDGRVLNRRVEFKK